MWQKLYEELRDRPFTVLAVAMDSRPDAARPWIEKARPEYPVLIDREHRVAELYHMVNVPQAVWIDEEGRIVRPAETAGAHEGFRSMDRATRTVPEEVATVTRNAKQTYVKAIRDWVLNGANSEHAFDEAAARAHLNLPSEQSAQAHALFRLGQVLIRSGQSEEGEQFLREAIRLHPDSWNFYRQREEPSETGLASSQEFWERVQALGDRKYYASVDMKGMPR